MYGSTDTRYTVHKLGIRVAIGKFAGNIIKKKYGAKYEYVKLRNIFFNEALFTYNMLFITRDTINIIASWHDRLC